MTSRCEQIHLLFDYAAGRSSPSAVEPLRAELRAQVEQHLAGCADCRRELERLAALESDLRRLEQATRHDLPQAAAAALLRQADSALRSQHRAAGDRLEVLRQRARRQQRFAVVWRIMMPAAAAAVIFLAIYIVGPHVTMRSPEPYPAIRDLYAQANAIQTVEGINALEPTARRALDEAMLAPAPDLGQVANLQLVRYITLRAVEPQQIEDIHFLLALIQEDERRAPKVAHRPDFWDWLAHDAIGASGLASLEPTASAATAGPDASIPARRDAPGWADAPSAANDAAWYDATRRLLAAGRYDETFALLAKQEATRPSELMAYAAIRAGRLAEAREILAALAHDAVEASGLAEPDRGDAKLVELLRAELEMAQLQFEQAMRHFAAAAETDSRLWFQAAYLCKYELHDDAQAGKLFERTGDDRVAFLVERRFRGDVTVARRFGDMLLEDFEDYPVASLPPNWRLIPTHAGEFQIARLDDSNVLKQNELGYEGAKLMTGYPGWNNYTLSCDFKVLQRGREPQLQIVVYDQGLSDYALSLDGSAAQLVERTYDAALGNVDQTLASRTILPQPLATGLWWRCEVSVRNVAPQQTQVVGTLWLRDAKRPDKPQIAWTHTGTPARPALQKGRVGFRLANAEVAFDNVSVTASDEGIAKP